MKKFLIKVIVFSIPILFLGMIPFLFLLNSGEYFTNIDNVIINNEKYLIGYAYHEDNYKYIKYKELQSRNSLSIIALGSSSVLQFRDQMFTKPFYNAGFTIISISDFIPFIKANLDVKKPEILLIALDRWMFNEKWDDLSDYNIMDKNWEANFESFAKPSHFIKIYSDFSKGKYGVEVLTNNRKINGIYRIGLNAIVNSYGFRKDGSMYYIDKIKKLLDNDSSSNDLIYEHTYSLIDKGISRFEYGGHINEKSIKALYDMLEYCEVNNIYVVGILPPFADKVNNKLKSSGKYTYMDSIYLKSNELFKEQGFELWDMSSLEKYNSNDSEVIDGYHGGEVSYLKMLIYMVENGSILGSYTNKIKLMNNLNNRKNNYEVYGYD